MNEELIPVISIIGSSIMFIAANGVFVACANDLFAWEIRGELRQYRYQSEKAKRLRDIWPHNATLVVYLYISQSVLLLGQLMINFGVVSISNPILTEIFSLKTTYIVAPTILVVLVLYTSIMVFFYLRFRGGVQNGSINFGQ